MQRLTICLLFFLFISGCSGNEKTSNETQGSLHLLEKEVDPSLPTIGILVFEGVIINEVVASLDVFSASDSTGKKVFNVVTIAKESKVHYSAQGLKFVPDITIDQSPELTVLVIPSSYSPTEQTADKALVNFVQDQNETTDYIASHCSGAFLLGESGIADNKNVVTYVSGSSALKSSYPNLKVADDELVAVVQDGKFISSNGSMVSYTASFDLLETMTSIEHRAFVERTILFDRMR